MNLRNVLTVLGTAAVTAALTLALLAPRGGDARAGAAVQPVIAQPQLSSQGCTFTLKTDKATYEAGESPKIEVTATNPTATSVTASVWVTVTSRSPANPRSRMLSIPVPIWTHEYAFTLPPDGTKSITETCAALPAGQNVAITLTDQNNAVLMGNVGVPPGAGPNGAPPAPAKK
jgi:hypothetical protein